MDYCVIESDEIELVDKEGTTEIVVLPVKLSPYSFLSPAVKQVHSVLSVEPLLKILEANDSDPDVVVATILILRAFISASVGESVGQRSVLERICAATKNHTRNWVVISATLSLLVEALAGML